MTNLATDLARHHPAAALFPMLPDDELAELAADIKANGLIEPVWMYQDPELGLTVLDGRNRLKACGIAGVEPRTYMYTGADPIEFAVSVNVRRRHLSPGQLSAVTYAVLELFEVEAARLRAAAAVKGNKTRAQPGGMDSLDGEITVPVTADRRQPGAKKQRAPTAVDKAAKATGAKGRNVAKFKRITEQAPDLAALVVADKITLDRAERTIRDRAAEQRRVEQAKRDAELAGQQTTVDIRHGDFRTTLADLAGVDAIITDPPYPHEFIPLLADLATWADKILKPDGVLVVLMGQTYLPEVYRLLEGGRPYRWTGAYLTEGPGYASHKARVQSSWKPLLVYGGGPRFGDVIRSSGDDKAHHKWGQNYDAFHTIIERFTTKGQTVVDPFMGAGTTLLAAHALGRHAIGADVDAESVEAARGRFA